MVAASFFAGAGGAALIIEAVKRGKLDLWGIWLLFCGLGLNITVFGSQ